jgi:nitrate reductase NapE component
MIILENTHPGSETAPVQKKSAVLNVIAQFCSVILHPLFVPLWVTYFLLNVHPDLFVGFSAADKSRTFLIVAVNLCFFPLLSVLLLKALGFIDSIMLKTTKDRIIPYMACGIFFFWAYLVFKRQPEYPGILTAYTLGLFLSASGALLANIYFKISMHAIGFGTLLGLFLYLFASNSMLMAWPLTLAILLTGLISSFRLYLQSHQPVDIYAGLVLGIVAQYIAIISIL